MNQDIPTGFFLDSDREFKSSVFIQNLLTYYSVERHDYSKPETSLILGLKKRKKPPIDYFAKQIEDTLKPGLGLVVVPSSSADAGDSGISLVVKKLAATGKFVDLTGCLIRHKTLQEKHLLGSRTDKEDRESLRIQNPGLLKGKNIVLVDDVVTSGNSMKNCGQVLLDAGIGNLRFLSMGLTDGRDPAMIGNHLPETEFNRSMQAEYRQWKKDQDRAEHARIRAEHDRKLAEWGEEEQRRKDEERKLQKKRERQLRKFEIAIIDVNLIAPSKGKRLIEPEDLIKFEFNNPGMKFGLLVPGSNSGRVQIAKIQQSMPDFCWDEELTICTDSSSLIQLINSIGPSLDNRICVFHPFPNHHEFDKQNHQTNFFLAARPKKEVGVQHAKEGSRKLGSHFTIEEMAQKFVEECPENL